MGFHHRAGAQRQSNKRHKNSNASKRSIARKSGGKIEKLSRGNPKMAALNKKSSTKLSAKTKKHQKKNRQAKLDRLRRGVLGAGLILGNKAGNSNAVVLNVGIINLSITGSGSEENLLEQSMVNFLQIHSTRSENVGVESERKEMEVDNEGKDFQRNGYAAKYAMFQKQKCRLLTTHDFLNKHEENLLSADDSRILAALDLARVCQVLMFILDTTDVVNGNGTDENEQLDDMLSETGERLLNAVKAQGLGSKIYCIATGDGSNGKAQQKYASRLATTVISPSCKLITLQNIIHSSAEAIDAHTKAQMSLLCRNLALGGGGSVGAKWTLLRPFIVSEGFDYLQDKEELCIRGYISGHVPWSCRDLVHVPNVGTFRAKSAVISKLSDSKRKSDDVCMHNKDDNVTIINSGKQQLEMFATPNALDGEQNLIGFEDDDMDDASDGESANLDSKENKEGINTGSIEMWSSYQSAWLADASADAIAELQDDDIDNRTTLLNGNNDPFNSNRSTGEITEDADANELTKKQFREEQAFPDEIELQQDMAARDRLARYRSVKSFRESEWDPLENLPDDYSKLYAFRGIKGIERELIEEQERRVEFGSDPVTSNIFENNDHMDSIHDDEEDESVLLECIPAGTFISLTLEKVSFDQVRLISGISVLCAVTLLEHENKASVCQMSVQMGNSCEPGDTPVKSKDVLTIRCGWRTWQARPIYSETNLNSNKHKYSRFLTPHSHLTASVYGPVTFGNAPVLMFREADKALNNSLDATDRRQLIAIGSMTTSDPNRVIVKRAILTGFPTRVHKRHAVVRYMFFNPEDVKWFKPAQLTTKHGLVGNIISSVGEHGTMKCLFNKGVLQHDTVCLVLYKRVFPKFVDKEGCGSDLVVL